jgi:hypothetical protein
VGTLVTNRRREPSSRTLVVAVGYVVAALVMTWPLALGMHRDVPGDLGDSLAESVDSRLGR